MGDLGRLAVLVLAVLAAAASTTSNNPPPQYNQYPQQQYPQQQYPQQQQPLPPAPQGAPQAQWTPCDYACAQLARCNLSPYAACDQQCKAQGTEQDPNGARGLDEIARTDCQRLAQMMRDMQQPQQPAQPGAVSQPGLMPPPSAPAQPAAPPPSSGGGQRQWQCNASGSWQTCAASGFPCTPQFASAFAFGPNEALARSGAETQCNSNMTALVSASFASHARVVASCRATTCTPP